MNDDRQPIGPLLDALGVTADLLVLLGAFALIGAGAVVVLMVRAVREATALVRQRRAKGPSDRHRALRAVLEGADGPAASPSGDTGTARPGHQQSTHFVGRPPTTPPATADRTNDERTTS